jgi:hypothetical protein
MSMGTEKSVIPGKILLSLSIERCLTTLWFTLMFAKICMRILIASLGETCGTIYMTSEGINLETSLMLSFISLFKENSSL